MKKILLAVLVALATTLPSGAASASPLTPEKVTSWPFDSWNNAAWTAVSSSPMTGNSVVVYFYQATNDGNNPAGSYFAQLLDPEGKAIGSPSLLSETGVNIWKGPAVAWNPLTGGWLACWSEEAGGGAADTYCKAVSANGEAGTSNPRVISLTNIYAVNSVAWDPVREEFLVTGGAGGSSGGAFVKPSGELSQSINASIAPTDFASCGGANVGYSPTSRVFGVAAYGKKTGDAECGPWFWTLDSSTGGVLKDPVRIDPDASVRYKQQSIAWNAARDEFVVMSVRDKNPKSGANIGFVTQRYKSSDGQAVGSLQVKDVSSTYRTNRWRPILIANPQADQMRAFVTLEADDADDLAGLYSMAVAEDGSLSDPELVTGGESSFYTGPRPWWGFNPQACNYLGTFRGVAPDSQLYTVRDTQPLPCKSQLSVTKSGTGSGSVTGTATDSSELSMQPVPVTDGTTELYRSTSVTLSASASDGSTFDGWSGACSGTGACTVSMSEARSVTATFTGTEPTPPTPPSNQFTITSSASRGSSAVTRVRVPGAGKIRQRGTYRTAGANPAAARTACTATRTATAAGTYTLTCRLNSAARRQRSKGALRVRVLTTFTPTGGTPRSAVRTVVFRSLKPNYTG